MSVVKITRDNFESEVINSQKPVLLDFWAAWCGPCKMAAPVVDEIAGELPSVKVCKVNIDEEPELADRFRITSIPTFIVMKDGNIINKAVGLRPKKELVEMVK